MQKGICASVVAFVFAVGFSPAHAYTVSNRTIESIHVNSTSGIYFKTSEAMVNPETCTQDAWYHVARNSSYEKEIYAMLLAAQTSGTKIRFYLDGCENDIYPRVTWVRTEPS